MPTYTEDYKELKELLTFGFALQDAINRSLDDGDIDFQDIGNLWPVVVTAQAAFQNLGNPVERFRNMTPDEKAEIIGWAAERFDLRDDMLEYLIEDTLQEIVAVVLLAKRWTKYIKPQEDTAEA